VAEAEAAEAAAPAEASVKQAEAYCSVSTPAYGAALRHFRFPVTLLDMAGDDRLRKLIGWGEVAIGLGFLIRGGLRVTGRADPSPVGRFAQLERPALPQHRGNVVQSARLERVGDINQRVDKIKKLILKDSLSPIVREEALGILTQKCGNRWCVREKDYEGEISALFWALRDPKSPYAMRYTRDHVYVDQFHGSRVLRKLSGGDCDDGSVRLGAWLLAVGYPIKLRVIHAKGAPSWSHIYLLAGVPPTNPTKWIPLDWSVEDAKPGWEAPGAAESARTGRPAGVVVKVKDFDVEMRR